MRKRSKSVHTSVPFSLEIDPKPEAASDEEFEIPDLDQTNAFSGAEDNESDGQYAIVMVIDWGGLISIFFLFYSNRMEQWR